MEMNPFKWSYPVPGGKSHWKELLDKEEKKILKVRNQIRFSSLSSIPIFSPNIRSKFNNKNISNDKKFKQIKPIEIGKKSFNPVKYFRGRVNPEPILQISPPTPSIKSINKRENKPDAGSASVIRLSNGNSLQRQNIPDRKVYSKSACPFHRNTTEIPIFDDRIEKYITDVKSNRTIMPQTKYVKIQRNSEHFQELTTNNEKLAKPNVIKNDIHEDDYCNGIGKQFIRTPKLGTASLQPSFSKTIYGSLEEINISQTHPATVDEKVDMIGKTDTFENHLKFIDATGGQKSKSIDVTEDDGISMFVQESQLPADLESEKDLSDQTSRKSKLIFCENKINNEETKTSIRRPLKYSIQCAYRALRFLKPNKILNSHIQPCDINNSIKRNKQQWKNINENSKSNKSVTITSRSRSTSGISTKFIKPDLRTNTNDQYLSQIQNISLFPRKTLDRCLPCLYETFSTRKHLKTELPLTTLRRLVVTKREDDCSNSTDSSELLDEILSSEKLKGHDYKFIGETVPPINENNLPPSIGKIQTIQFEDIPGEPTRGEFEERDSPEDPETRTEISKFVSPLSIGNSSMPDHSSDENESLLSNFDDKSTKSKYLAPCHTQVVFRPNLEPLRALKLKKPVSLRSRIMQNEVVSSSKDDDDDDDEDDDEDKFSQETKSRPVTVEGFDRKRKPVNQITNTIFNESGKILTRVKSLAENLTPNIQMNARVLERGFSCSNIEDKKIHENNKEKSKLNKANKEIYPSDEEIIEILKEHDCYSKTLSQSIQILCNEFLKRLSLSNDKSKQYKSHKTIKKLIKLLIDSQTYLYPEEFPSNLVFSSKQSSLIKARQLRRYLPTDTFNLVAPMLEISEHRKVAPSTVRWASMHKTPQVNPSLYSSEQTDFDLFVHPPPSEDLRSFEKGKRSHGDQVNPYAKFLKKSRKHVVTWRPLTEKDMTGYDPEATLKMRARHMTDKICQDFCQWLRSLGGHQELVDEEVLRDMFEIDFSADASKSMEMHMKEMPMVPTEVAMARNCPQAGELAMTKRHLIRDAKAEKQVKKLIGFGTGLPLECQFLPPKNRVQEHWLQNETISSKLKSMDIDWENMKNLNSVRHFIQWLENNRQINLPPTLKIMLLKSRKQTKQGETSTDLE